MAGLKKNKRTKDTTSPNLVLVLFLIVFILSNIILGLWVYFNYDEVNKALAAKTSAEKVQRADKQAMEVYQIAADDFRQAIGQKLTADEVTALELKRKEMLAGKYDNVEKEKTDAYKKLIGTLRADLKFDDNGGAYTTTYKDEAAKALKERDDAVATVAKLQKQLKEAQDVFKTLDEKQEAYFASTTAKLDKDRKDLNKIANTQSDQMKMQIQKNDELRQAIADADARRAKIELNYKKQIKELEQVIADKDKGAETVATRDNREPHALLLDISLGKPLWDDPVGTITRVDYKAKEVTINLGSAKGVRPDLTFNVFAPSKYVATRAEKQLKGTIEVVRVLGPHASVARITANFDPDFPITEGDLLFNLFWGTRVAVTGYVGVTGLPTDSPSEQMRQLNDFMYLLSRQGIVVDAYLDLTDGQIKGALTPNTRYLIRGEPVRAELPKGKDDELPPGAKRAIDVNNGIVAMTKDATEKGIFVISANNFATVIGYHREQDREHAGFQPQLPAAGPVLPGLSGGVGAVGGQRIEAAPAPMPPPMAEPKKDAEPKEKE